MEKTPQIAIIMHVLERVGAKSRLVKEENTYYIYTTVPGEVITDDEKQLITSYCLTRGFPYSVKFEG